MCPESNSGFFILGKQSAKMTDDQKWMRLALRLAKRGSGKTSPNPMVGAVIVKDGRLIGRGYHRKFGGPHAEVFALREAGRNAHRATMYVTLEPCSHYGKTPPCADRIIEAGLRRVVVATPDPNPLVNGEGIRKLRKAGIEVTVGVESEKAEKLNEAFFKFMRSGLPFVTLKIAQTLDGKIATPGGDSRWISGEASRRLVHRWRSQMDAVLVGIGTVLKDDPELTVRLVKGRNPKRIVLDPNLDIPLQSKLVRDAKSQTILVAAKKNTRKIDILREMGVFVLSTELATQGEFDLNGVLKSLTDFQIISILVEGGSGVFSSFLRQRAFDRLAIFQAPKILGAGLGPFDSIVTQKMSEALPLKNSKWRRVGEDWLFEFDAASS